MQEEQEKTDLYKSEWQRYISGEEKIIHHLINAENCSIHVIWGIKVVVSALEYSVKGLG